MKTKHILLLSLLLITTIHIALCQQNSDNYQLFSANDQKYFADANLVKDSVYCLKFDTVYQQDDLQMCYENFKILGEWFTPENCVFWGAEQGRRKDLPSWIGEKIREDEAGVYRFINLEEEEITFNINIPQGDSTLLYEDEEQRFYAVADGEQQTDILGNSEQALIFHIVHTNPEGQVINSNLHQHQIIIGENTGLASFFRIDHFPEMLEPVTLLGNLITGQGFVGFTHEKVYDFQVGDIFQYEETQAYGAMTYQKWTTEEYLSRTDTEDSIIYLIHVTWFDIEDTVQHTTTITRKYLKNATINAFPVKPPLVFQGHFSKSIVQDSFQGTVRWKYSENTVQMLDYCEADNCWGPADVPAENITQESWVFGMGRYSYQQGIFQNYTAKNIIYYKKGDLEWGNHIVLDTEYITYTENAFLLYPNPANDYIILDSEIYSSGSYKIISTDGQVLLSGKISERKTIISTENLKSGIYLIQFFNNKGNFIRKFLKK